MQAGKLRHRVQLQYPSDTRDAHGGITRSWSTSATVWASVEPLTGRELLDAQQVESQSDTRVRIRYYQGIAPKWRVQHGQHVYNVLHVGDVDVRNREMLLLCTGVALLSSSSSSSSSSTSTSSSSSSSA